MYYTYSGYTWGKLKMIIIKNSQVILLAHWVILKKSELVYINSYISSLSEKFDIQKASVAFRWQCWTECGWPPPHSTGHCLPVIVAHLPGWLKDSLPHVPPLLSWPLVTPEFSILIPLDSMLLLLKLCVFTQMFYLRSNPGCLTIMFLANSWTMVNI